MMSRSTQVISLTFLLAAMFGVGGYVHGILTDRFPQAVPDDITASFERIPMTIGDWQGIAEKGDINDAIKVGHDRRFQRLYVNQKDGTSVSVLVTSGRPGPMVTQHLPTECYPCAGYETAEQPKRFLLTHSKQSPNSPTSSDGDAQSKEAVASNNASGKADDFFVARFKKTPAEGGTLNVRVYWSWTGDGVWKTPEHPRIEFAGVKTLYKVYFARTMADESESFDGSPVHAFMQAMCNEMRETVFVTESRK
jgi:hypothetical protein